MFKKWFLLVMMGLAGAFLAISVNVVQAGSDTMPSELSGEYVALNPTFIVNLNTTGKPLYAQVDVELKLEGENIQAYIKYHLAAIRHELIMLFSSKNRADVKTRGGRDDLRKEALKRVQRVLKSEEGFTGVEQVLFTKFVVQ